MDPAQTTGASPPPELLELAELRSQLARYRAAFELSVPGQALIGLTGRFLEANASLCQILGYSQAELQSRRFLDITHPDDQAEGQQAAIDMQSGKLAQYRCEKRYLRPDGRTVWALVTAHLARDAAGQPLYFAAVIEDITERKAAPSRAHAAVFAGAGALAGLSRAP